MRRLGYLTLREYANVILWILQYAMFARCGMFDELDRLEVPVVTETGEPRGVSAQRACWTAVERYIWQTRCFDPNRRFWHDGGS